MNTLIVISRFLYQPVVFLSFSTVLTALSGWAVFAYFAGLKEQKGLTRELMSQRELVLQNEIANREKIKSELETAKGQLFQLENSLKLKEQELSLVAKLKEELDSQDKEYRQTLLKAQNEIKDCQENKRALKEQILVLERKADAISQALALEKSLHQRLKEEHAACSRPVSG